MTKLTEFADKNLLLLLRVVIDWTNGKLTNCINDLEHTGRQKAFCGFGFVCSFFDIFKALEGLL